MAKSIKESYGPVQYHNSLTMLARESRNCGDNCQCDDCGCGQIDENKKAERLAKIARAAAAREKDQSKEKEKATAKHNKASAKSREAIKYRGNKDQFGRVREDIEITESDKAEYDKLMKQYGDMPASKIPPKIYMRISQLGRKVRGDKGGPKVGDLLKSMKKRKMGEAVDQVDEAFSSSIIKKMKQVLDRTGTGDINAAMKINDTLPKDAKKVLSKVKNSKELDKYLKANEEVEITEAKKTIKLSSGDVVEIGKIDRGNGKTHYYWKHKSGLKNMFPTLEKMRYSLRNDGNFKGAEKVTKQLGESLRQRADDSMTFSNRQAAFSAAFMKAHSRKPTKQELRDAGVGKGGDNPAGAKAYQKAMSKLRPASRSGIKDKFVHNEEVEIDEAEMGAIARNVKKGDSPYTVVAIVNKKVVDQDHAKVADQVPALVRELQKEYPNAKISVEDRGGRVVHSESFVDEGRIGGGFRSFRGSGMKNIRIRDDEGYRKDGSNPVDDAIAKRNAARRKEAVRKAQAGDKTKKGK